MMPALPIHARNLAPSAVSDDRVELGGRHIAVEDVLGRGA
jgi:hypothetical protein